MFTDQQLATIMACPLSRAVHWGDALREGMARQGITTPRRIACFLAQVGHESLGLQRVEENLNYSAPRLIEVFGNYFSAANAGDYARRPERIANRAYANRNGNGSEGSGDGWRFRGRGPMQHTGRRNYRHIGELLGIQLEETPELLAEVEHGAAAAAAYWRGEQLNGLADQVDVLGISRRINLGNAKSRRMPNGLQDRISRTHRALRVLGAR